MRRENVILHFSYIVFAALFVYGCAGNSGTTTKNMVMEENVSKQTTASTLNFSVPKNAAFAWHPNTLSSSPDKDADTVRIEAQVRQAIKESLTDKGYIFVSATTSWPDYFVGYVFLADTVLDDDMVSKYFDLMPRMRPNPDVKKRYGKGTLVIDIIDPTAFRVLWRTSTPALIDGDASEPQQLERIRLKIDDLFSGFPDNSS